MDKKFVYLIAKSRIVCSVEDATTILNRASNEIDKAEIELLIEANRVGNFCELSTGEVVFQRS